MLKVLIVHERYTRAGGEDEVVAAESALLRRKGHVVIEYVDDNRRIGQVGRLRLAAETIWSRATHRDLSVILRRERPDIAHFHNTFPLISPAAYYACQDAGVPVVQTLHNYRLLCPNALFLREGKPCELCLGRNPPWPGVVHACYHRSRGQTAVIAAMLAVHRWLRTFSNQVDAYIALTRFAQDTFLRAGFPPEKIFVKPNFFDPDAGKGAGQEGFALFVGRLSHDKGLDTLLAAWRRHTTRHNLIIVGDGPLADRIAASASELRNIECLGWKPRSEVIELMKRASLLIVPSLAYEGFPMIIAEAFSTGLPVIVSGHGALAEIVEDGATGLHFRPGDEEDLAAKLDALLGDTHLLEQMRQAARAEFESKYTAERNYHLLLDIYGAATGRERIDAEATTSRPRRPEHAEASR